MTTPTKKHFILSILAACILLPSLALWFTTQPFVSPIASKPPAVDEMQLKKHVQWLSQTNYPRSFDFPQKLDAAADYIRAEFAATGAAVTVQEFKVEEGGARNIIARFGPREGRC